MTAVVPVGGTPQPAPSVVAPAGGFQAALGRLLTLGEFVGTTSGAGGPAVGGLGTPAVGGLGDAGYGGVDGAAAVMDAASRYLGVPYRWGGTDPATGLDCSGFVQRVYADLGISLPRVSVDQAKQGSPVASLDQARPGDLVFWNGSPNHIGIYDGGGRMIVAPRTGDVVKFQDITRTPDAIRRIL